MTDPGNFRDLLQMGEADLLSLAEKEVCPNLVELVLSGEAPAKALRICLILSAHPGVEVRGVVASCFGHLARMHKSLDLSEANLALNRISADKRLSGRANDALEDIRLFHKD